MAHELAPIDITQLPELAHAVDEVRRTGRPRRIRRADEDVALLAPLPPAAPAPLLTEDDPLFGLAGIGDSGIPGGISGHKHEALGRLRHT
jgi:hypothetical protein